MNRCPSERAVLSVYLKEATAAEETHLRQCAACAHRYETLVDDLHAINAVLTSAPPPMAEAGRLSGMHIGWLPAAAFVVVLTVVAGVIALRRPAPLPMTARNTAVAALAADVSAALFAETDVDAPLMESEPLATAFEAGRTCTQERYFDGECNDQLSVLLLEASD